MPDSDLISPTELLDQTTNLRAPPHSIQGEQSVLGGLMLDNSTWDQIADRVIEHEFYRREHQLIFQTIARLASEGKPFDLVTLAEALERQGLLQDIGGLAYLGLLAKDTPTAANIRNYADIVREYSITRQLISIGSSIVDSAFNPQGKSAAQLLEEAERKIFAITEQQNRGGAGFQPITSLLAKAVDRIHVLSLQNDPITGVATGFTDFDEKTAGLQPADLIIIAGRPSMGKTTFAMNIAENVAIEEHLPVAVFSLEMPGESLAMRMLSSLGRIDQHRVRTGKLLEDEWPRLASTAHLLDTARLYIDDTQALSPTEIRARARRLKRELGGLGLVVIDYLQLMQAPEAAAENRVNEISAISRSLKALAKELHVPVIALSQLNRNLEQRTDKRPVMSDLRESGSIEQDADLIAFIYRDEVYHENSPDKGLAEVLISKQRNGPTGIVKLTFLGQYTKFENYTADTYGEQSF